MGSYKKVKKTRRDPHGHTIPHSLSVLPHSSREARPLFSPIHNTAPAERNPGTLRCSGQIRSPRTALAMPSLYIPASLCAASYPSPCGRAPWLLPAAARDGRRAHYCGSRSNTPLLHRHTSLAASSRETTNYTSSRATSEIDEPDDNGKLESPPTSSTRNRTTAMSRSSTVDLGALLPGVAPLAKPKPSLRA
uniref:Uncharacterized protein n=2 Tax=Triticum TaxID=4564 RepID=A0A8R7PYI1_TRIUA